jgi:O-methyltransferase involved in polyketide biosynthesis
MYLTDEAIAATLAFIASTPPGGGVAFDYAVPRASLGWLERRALDAMMQRVAAAGEPFRTFIDPRDLPRRLTRAGFRAIQDLGRDALNARYFPHRADGLRISGGLGRLASAEV